MRTASARRANAGLRDKCRVLVVALLEQFDAEALGVRAQLLDGAGAKRVARDKRNLCRFHTDIEQRDRENNTHIV